jgi:hypothetical protein
MNKLHQCSVCNQGETDNENVLLSCEYCNNNTHKNYDGRALTEEGKSWNTYQCPHCDNKHKHPTVREEERVEPVNKAEDKIWEYNERHSGTCCRCQVKLKVGGGRHETNLMLSCASCVRSAHEYGCAKEAELVHGQYWQCEECRASKKPYNDKVRGIHPAYQTLQRQTFENIHQNKKSKLNSLKKWDIKNGNKHDRTTEQKRREKHRMQRGLTCEI